jgi:hypothetical protein
MSRLYCSTTFFLPLDYSKYLPRILEDDTDNNSDNDSDDDCVAPELVADFNSNSDNDSDDDVPELEHASIHDYANYDSDTIA